MRRILGLFAHPDDEVFCAGGTMARAAHDGAEVRVVSFTQGEAGSIRDASLARRSNLGQVRTAELRAACAHLGVADSRCLGFADGRLASASRTELIDAAIDQIREFRPDTVITFDETGAYGHPDHMTMSEIAVEASCLAGDSGIDGDHPPHTPDRVLHACFPRRERLLLDLLVEWLVTLPERFRGTETFVNALLMFADSSSMLGFAADHLAIEWFPSGSYVIEQGETADSLYLLLSGSVDVVRESADGSVERVGVVNVGEFLGEVGLAYGQQRNAHCIASENAACFVLTARPDEAWKPRGGAVHTVGESMAGRSLPTDTFDLVNDVGDLVATKVAALAEHRTQYTIAADLFPEPMMRELLGTEYFRIAWQSPGAPGAALANHTNPEGIT